MKEKYISILEHAAKDARTSTLVIEPTSGALRVMGNLPHGYAFKAKTVSDAEALRDYFAVQAAKLKSKAREVS